MFSLGYIAGFFDGEGSIGIYKSGSGSFYLRTQLTQNVSTLSTALLEDICARWGGNLSVQKTSHGEKYNWQLNGKRAAKFLSDIVQELYLKKDQAEIAILWQESRPKKSRDDTGKILSKKRSEDAGISQLLKDLKKYEVAREVIDEHKKILEGHRRSHVRTNRSG